jgi:hypothetical protein
VSWGLSPWAFPGCFGADLLSLASSDIHSPIRQDALCNLTNEDKEQHKGQDPAKVVPWEMEPRAMVDVYLGALTAPSCRKRQ